jgi:hypothetical protein
VSLGKSLERTVEAAGAFLGLGQCDHAMAKGGGL